MHTCQPPGYETGVLKLACHLRKVLYECEASLEVCLGTHTWMMSFNNMDLGCLLCMYCPLQSTVKQFNSYELTGYAEGCELMQIWSECM